MSYALFRSIVGKIIPRIKGEDIPTPYRPTFTESRTTMKMQGSKSSGPSGTEKPTTELPDNKTLPIS